MRNGSIMNNEEKEVVGYYKAVSQRTKENHVNLEEN
jgi:hypothetical protein